MNLKYREEALRLTQYILEEYWQGNLKPVKEHIHKNILWIGSMDSEYYHGAEEMLQRLEENTDKMPPVYLDQKEYEVTLNEGNTCVIVGRYRAYTKPESGMILSEKQRVTFVWQKYDQNGTTSLLIKHLHLSNILHIQSEEERFPTKAGKYNYEYVQRIMAERSRDEVISLKDENHVNRVINYSDIMYIEAQRNYIRLYLANGQRCMRVRSNITKFCEGLPEGFIRVGRSYCVNRSYVKSIKKQQLEMIDETIITIPERSCSQIRQAIIYR